VATTAAAQLAAPQQPSQRLLVLPFQASAADSAGSIALADAVRDRVTALTKNRLLVVPKAKLCEALKASGFPCDGLLDDQQARQLARFLQVHAYLTGTYAKSGAALTADVHLIDISSSGMAGSFTASNGNPLTAAALADSIAKRVATIVRISEPIRNCNDERKKGQFARARAEAHKALAVDPNSTSAHLCLATVFEAQRLPDSVLVESQRALKGDSSNGTAWENIARIYQQRGDTAKMVDAFLQQLRRGEPRNTSKRLGIAQLLRQMKQYQQAVDLLDEGLKVLPGDTQLLDLELTICNEASLYACSARVFFQKAQHDTALVADTTFIKPAIGAAQQASDTAALDLFTAVAVRHFPTNMSFVRTRAGYFELAGKPDSALVYYKRALAAEPNDVSTSLQIAKILIDRAVYDTAAARQLRERKDTVGLRHLQQAFAARVDSARPFLRPGLHSADSTQRLAASVIMLTGGSKLAQAAAYDQAYVWLDTLLQVVAPKNASDTLGPRFQVRVNGSFWYGLASTLTFGKPYGEIAKLKPSDRERCDKARGLKERLSRTKASLQLGRRVHPPTADQMLGFVGQYEKALPQMGRAFKCANF
jgi:Tfp pilus assembly protein PilF/TolB-like protein